MSDVSKCETIIAELERKRAACVQRGTELADERAASRFWRLQQPSWARLRF
jgi:hypothetical protein